MQKVTYSNELPFDDASIECAGLRAVSAKMKVPGIPVKFNLHFIGTGSAAIPIQETQKLFDEGDNLSTVMMDWYSNKFVGTHWLIGDFSVELADTKQSKGIITASKNGDFGQTIVNENQFFFDFKFKRFPFMNMVNETPIVNAAIISSIPPTGSVFKLDSNSKNIMVKTGENRNKDQRKAPRKTISFDYCDATVFPEKNVELSLINQNKLNKTTYEVTVEIKNVTEKKAIFTYFSVIHFEGVSVEDDHSFKTLKPDESLKIIYKVSSQIPNRILKIPFFCALYKPVELNGSKSLDLSFEF